MNTFKHIKNDPHFTTTLLFALLVTASKRWGVGSSVDPAWYMALCKNVALNSNYLEFSISKYTYTHIHDHMPLTYWIIGSLFKVFGISTFVAKIYPIFCSFFSYVLVYQIGKKIKDSFFGLCSVLALATSIHFLKWGSQVMHEVPLTFFFLLTTLFLIKAITENPKFYYGCSIGMVLGILTKGPVIGAIPLALIVWVLIFRRFDILKSIHFYLSLLLMISILLIFLLPPFLLDGKSIYEFFYIAKKSYVSATNQNIHSFFLFFRIVLKQSFILVFLLFSSIYYIFRKRWKNIEIPVLMLLISLAIIIPFSFYSIKFAHYIVPIYPFMAFVAAISIYSWPSKYQNHIRRGVHLFSFAMIIIMIIFPIQVTGKRSKHNINMAKLLQFDSQNRPVYFYGGYKTDMKLVTEYSFYAGIDVQLLQKSSLANIDLKKSYVIVPIKVLPVKIRNKQLQLEDCFALNDRHCILADRKKVQFKLPSKKLPHEIYLSRK